MSTLPLRRPRLHAPIFVQRDGTARLGWHPERSFVVTPPPGIEPEALLDLLRRLDGVHSRAHMIWYAGTIGLSANAMSTMLAELGESGLLSEGTARASTERAVVAGLAASPLTVIERPGAAASRTTGPDDDRSRCDIALLTDDMAPDPAVVTRLVRTRTPHLQVRLRDGRGIVGPFVLPGVSSCLRCADLFRCSADPQWPHVSAQLLGRVGEADRPTVLAAAAIALAQIEAFADGRRAPLQDTTVEIDLNDSSVSRRTWSRHPRCDCSLL